MTIDVTDILVDAELTDTFTVIRRKETVDVHGRSSVVETKYPNTIGVVTAVSPNDLDRQDGYQVMNRSISIVSNFFLQGEVTGYQPDLILWRGNKYIVKTVDPYPQFGEGFMQAEAMSEDRTDTAFPKAPPSQLAFNDAANSGYMVTLC